MEEKLVNEWIGEWTVRWMVSGGTVVSKPSTATVTYIILVSGLETREHQRTLSCTFGENLSLGI